MYTIFIIIIYLFIMNCEYSRRTSMRILHFLYFILYWIANARSVPYFMKKSRADGAT